MIDVHDKGHVEFDRAARFTRQQLSALLTSRMLSIVGERERPTSINQQWGIAIPHLGSMCMHSCIYICNNSTDYLFYSYTLCIHSKTTYATAIESLSVYMK